MEQYYKQVDDLKERSNLPGDSKRVCFEYVNIALSMVREVVKQINPRYRVIDISRTTMDGWMKMYMNSDSNPWVVMFSFLFWKRQMPFYAILKGAGRGVYDSWAEAESLVRGVSGAVYRKFQTRQDAECYFRTNGRYDREQTSVKFEHIVITPRENVHRVDLWNKYPGGLEFRSKIDYDPQTVSSAAEAELLGVASAISQLKNEGARSREPENVWKIRIDVSTRHAYNVLTRYVQQWLSNGWRDSRNKPIKPALKSVLVDILRDTADLAARVEYSIKSRAEAS